MEALTAGLGVCLVAAGNVPIVMREGILTRPVTGVAPSELVPAWRAGDDRPLLRHLRTSVNQVIAGRRRGEGGDTQHSTASTQ